MTVQVLSYTHMHTHAHMHTCTHTRTHTHTHTHAHTHRFEADLDDYSIIMLKALADRLAEVTLELAEEDMAGYVLYFNTHCMCSKPPPPLYMCFVVGTRAHLLHH